MARSQISRLVCPSMNSQRSRPRTVPQAGTARAARAVHFLFGLTRLKRDPDHLISGLEVPGTMLPLERWRGPKLKTWLFGRAFLRQDS
jgi:hypothetical protein